MKHYLNHNYHGTAQQAWQGSVRGQIVSIGSQLGFDCGGNEPRFERNLASVHSGRMGT